MAGQPSTHPVLLFHCRLSQADSSRWTNTRETCTEDKIVLSSQFGCYAIIHKEDWLAARDFTLFDATKASIELFDACKDGYGSYEEWHLVCGCCASLDPCGRRSLMLMPE